MDERVPEHPRAVPPSRPQLGDASVPNVHHPAVLRVPMRMLSALVAIIGFLDCHPINFATQLISKILTRIRDYWERDKERERGAMKGS